jgi:sec-independent protein translocase protein TatC
MANIFREIGGFFEEEVEDTPLPEAFAKTVENPQEILVHLDALRKHLLRSVLVLALATAFAFVFNRQILGLLSRPLEGGMESLFAIEVTEPISTVMRVSLLTGFAIAFPYLALETWLFIGPGVKRQSRIFGLLAIPVAFLFFAGGMAFAYFIMLPASLPFLLNFGGIQTIPRISSYVKFVTSIMFWLGIAFEFPLVIYIFARIGLIQAKTLIKQWRLAIVIIAVISALITPTIDPVNMALVMGPMIFLYFLSIGLALLAQRGRVNETAIEEVKEEIL